MSPSAFAGSPALIADPDARVSREDADAFRARKPTGSTTGSRTAARGGPGAVRPRMEALRELRGRARRPHLRRHADLRRRRQRRPRRAPEALPAGFVAGVPPDSFAKTGQLWGNPLYDWTAMRADGYRWWIERFRRAFELVDLMRIDHFRGFVAYWAVPARQPDRAPRALAPRARARDALPRRRGRARRAAGRRGGPRRDHAGRSCGCATSSGCPGMVVLQFAFGGDPRNPHRPRTTTSTRSSTPARTTTTRRAAGGRRCPKPTRADRASTRPTRRWSLIGRAWRSRAALAIAPLQDVLGLGSEARMNLPGTEEGNWKWRFDPATDEGELQRRLRDSPSHRCEHSD